MSNKEKNGLSIIVMLLLGLFLFIYGCSVVFVKGEGNSINDYDDYKLRSHKSIDITKDTINFKKDTLR
jgi:hypothetical protein